MNLFIDPTIGPVLTFIFVICCASGAIFIIREAWIENKKKEKSRMPVSRYENYIIVDGEIIYPLAVVKHIDEKG